MSEVPNSMAFNMECQERSAEAAMTDNISLRVARVMWQDIEWEPYDGNDNIVTDNVAMLFDYTTPQGGFQMACWLAKALEDTNEAAYKLMMLLCEPNPNLALAEAILEVADEAE